MCAPRHRHQEFLVFLEQVASAYPRRRLHLICDTYATHNHPVVRGWLAQHRWTKPADQILAKLHR